jgi:hypothetical protein
MAPQNNLKVTRVPMLRCASFFVTATYEKVGLIPQNFRALPLEHFAMSSE